MFGNHVDAEEPFLQPRGDHAGIAAVVARPGEHEDVLAFVADQRRGDLGGRGARRAPSAEARLRRRRARCAGCRRTGRPDHARVDCKGTPLATIAAPCRTLRSLRALPRALANWAGFAGQDERPAARILMYHGTPRREAAALERELRWLKRRFHIVPLRAIVAAATNGGTLGSKVALTFDDGLRSNVEVAYPAAAPAGDPGDVLRLPGPGGPRALAVDPRDPQPPLAARAPRRARELALESQAPAGIDAVRALDEEARQRHAPADRARACARPRRTSRRRAAEREASDLADWKELRRLDPAIVTHRLAHPDAPDPAAAHRRRSWRRKCATAGASSSAACERPVDTFAYPNGDLDPASRPACASTIAWR